MRHIGEYGSKHTVDLFQQEDGRISIGVENANTKQKTLVNLNAFEAEQVAYGILSAVGRQQTELAALRLKNELEMANQQVATLTAALEYYADKSIYRLREPDEDGGVYLMCEIDSDDGERAREALAAVKAAGRQGENNRKRL